MWLQQWGMSAPAAGVRDAQLVVLLNRTTASEGVTPFHGHRVFVFWGGVLYELEE